MVCPCAGGGVWVEYLVEREILIETGGRWTCAAGVEEAGVPDRLRQMIERYLGPQGRSPGPDRRGPELPSR
jgi:hypothetical protein